MKTILDIILLLVGFVLLIKGADYFVDGSCAVAKRLRVPSIVIGLTIVAVGTSLPELAVSTFAAVKHSNAIALGNVVGSNIFNLLMVIGITALFKDMLVKKSILKREMPLLLIISVLLIFLAGDILWFGGIIKKNNIFLFENGSTMVGNVNRIDGILLLVLFVGFIAWTVSYALKERTEEDGTDEVIMLSKRKSAIFIVGGAIAIAVGGQVVVDSAKSLALAAGMSETLVGLTIVAMGTSAPEASVSIRAAFTGNNEIALSNIIGSNIFNGLIVVGICAFLASFKTDKTILKKDLPFNIIVTFILLIMLFDGKLSRLEGIFLILLMIIYLGRMIYEAICYQQNEDNTKTRSLLTSILFIVLGLAFVILGGQQVVDQACIIARNLGVSENFIGLTIVAIGTSLPELVTSIVATKKGESGLALGNAIGSNIFNILFILGCSATLSPLTVINESIIDCVILLVSSILLYLFAKTNKSMIRKEGLLCILLYIIYTAYLFIR